ncbi:1163_t:CDS:2 [Ambispora leptoticha]|uniref:1163_t:CDS:1 n=1 Tax=Ambispora leptoticha TaxID=144679 RepID=A0A9N9A3C1_9GLOM|nr:1163_t:CDS:2 [Ambispora leptoticha]
MANTFIYSKYNEASQNTAGGTLTYMYRWKITNWSDVRPFVEHTSPSFSADGLHCTKYTGILQRVFKFYKGRQRNPQAISLYLGILETTPGCLRGIRKKVSIVFVLENLRTRGMDFGKMELPVWFCEHHSTWGEENLMSLDEMDRFISNDTISLLVKFEVQESIIDAPPTITNPFAKLVDSPQFSDVTFRVIDEYAREKLFYAHKGILASASPVFEAMLTNGMKETFEDEIQLCQTNHAAFRALLTFIYTFKFHIGSLIEAEKLLGLSDRFGIVPVREECLRYFRLELNYDNVWGIWGLAVKYTCTKTSNTCRDYVALHLGDLLDKQSTLEADPNILRLALENDEANVSSEEKIFEMVIRWANYNTHFSTKNASTDTLPPSPSSVNGDRDVSPSQNDASASMPSELSDDCSFTINNINKSRKNSQSTNSEMEAKVPEEEDVQKVSEEEDEENNSSSSSNNDEINYINKGDDMDSEEFNETEIFPRPWCGDRLAALPSLLECVRFPMMQKRYLLEKVESNTMVMSADGMKDLLIEAYRYHLMPDAPILKHSLSDRNRRRKMKSAD